MSKNSKKLGKGAREIAAENQLRAFRLRQTGASYREIAAELNVGLGTAHRYVEGQLRILREKTALEAEHLITLECERLDKLQVAVWGKALGGDVRAGMAVLKIMERRAKLLGLDQCDRVRLHSNNAIQQLCFNLRFLMSREAYEEMLSAISYMQEENFQPHQIDELEAVRVLLESESFAGAFPDKTIEGIGQAYSNMKKAIANAFDFEEGQKDSS